MDLCPSDCRNKDKIPYLSTSSQIHVREIVHEEETFYVEDYIDSTENAEE
jgi:hypothetical protein